MMTKQKVRPLTNDEKKAAEAAFRGTPFQPTWSESARKIYQGIAAAMANRSNTVLSASSTATIDHLLLEGGREDTSRSRVKSQIR